jgi:hypothetical protein
MKPSALVLVLFMGALPVSGQRNPAGRSEPYVNNDSPAVTLLKMCDVSSPQRYATCVGYLSGAVMGIDASESLKDNRSICFPKDSIFTQGRFPGGDDLVRLFRGYVESHPDKLNVHIGHVMYQALLGTYPCKSN